MVFQEVWQGRLWSARPCIMVEDHEDLVVLWCPRGTVRKCAINPPTRPQESTRAERFVASLTQGDWVLADFEWDVSTLWLMPAGAWHAVWVSWHKTGEHWGWYVNLQEPFRRTPIGFQAMDLMLDLLVYPDRQWRWKDEDEFEAFIIHGLIGDTTALRVRDEAQRVIERVERNLPPFNEPWATWQPDPSWPKPELPEGWDQVY